MQATAAILSTYSADVFGACSALYELGGMVVIHDPSGCNSTYTTHDEPRWYDHESLIFISALSEEDAILGRDERLIAEVAETALALRPRFIALVPSQIPYLIGTDLAACARLIEKRTGILTFALPTSNMRYYTHGISLALERIARLAIEKNAARPAAPRGKRPRINLMGVTPLDLGPDGSLPYLKHWLAENDLDLAASWAMGYALDELIYSAPTADVSLVLSYGGLAAARLLQKAYGTPIVAGLPIGALKEKLVACLRHPTAPFAAPYLASEQPTSARETHGLDKSSPYGYFSPRRGSIHRARHSATPPHDGSLPAESPLAQNFLQLPQKGRYIICEGVAACSLAYALKAAGRGDYRPIIPVDTESALTGEAPRLTDEADLVPLLKDARALIADQLYQALTPAPFTPLPHCAFSGRLYESQGSLLPQMEAIIKAAP